MSELMAIRSFITPALYRLKGFFAKGDLRLRKVASGTSSFSKCVTKTELIKVGSMIFFRTNVFLVFDNIHAKLSRHEFDQEEFQNKTEK